MIPVLEQGRGLLDKVFLQVWYLATYPHGAESGFSSNVRIRGRDKLFDLGEQIPRHFDGGNVAEGAEGEADDILVRVGEVTVTM